jgi:radical SAM-linked protein
MPMRLRAEYSVGSDLRFLSNLDMMNLMARALRRAQIPFALSEGFNPHIRLSMGTVLPVGLWGKREYFDLELEREMAAHDFIEHMNQALPPAIRINTCLSISTATPTLMNSINCACYSFIINAPVEQLATWKNQILSRNELIVKSRGKKKDLNKNLRSGILKIEVNRWQDFAIIDIWGSIGEPLNVRYDELKDMLVQTGIDKEAILDVYRSGNYIHENDKYYTPLEKVK